MTASKLFESFVCPLVAQCRNCTDLQPCDSQSHCSPKADSFSGNGLIVSAVVIVIMSQCLVNSIRFSFQVMVTTGKLINEQIYPTCHKLIWKCQKTKHEASHIGQRSQLQLKLNIMDVVLTCQCIVFKSNPVIIH